MISVVSARHCPHVLINTSNLFWLDSCVALLYQHKKLRRYPHTLVVLCLRPGLGSKRCDRWRKRWSSASLHLSPSPSALQDWANQCGKVCQQLRETGDSGVASLEPAWARQQCSDPAGRRHPLMYPVAVRGLWSASLALLASSYWQPLWPFPACCHASPPSPSARDPPVGFVPPPPIV